MYSGGLDSFIMYHYALKEGYDPTCLHVDLGHPYGEKERRTFNMGGWFPEVDIIDMSSLYNLIEKRLSNQIIPSRNVLLGVIGSMFSERVWLGALDGEQLGKEHDKSPRFFEELTQLLSYTNEFFQPSTIVEAPFANMSKSETIEWAINRGIPLETLFETSTCYHPTIDKCGECLTCVKRWMSFKANGIDEPGYASNPLESKYMKELIIEIPKALKDEDYSRFTVKRCLEFLKVMNEI